MTIIPIFCRELVTAARQGRLHVERRSFVGGLFVVAAGSFAAWYYWSGGVLTSPTLVRISHEILRWGIAFHGGIVVGIGMLGVLAIARERERRTLDFLLITRLSSAEVVLGKMGAYITRGLAMLAAGFPMMLLLHVTLGVDLRMVLLAYAGFASTSMFLSALSIWISCESPGRGTAVVANGLCMMAWLIGPFSLTVFLPRLGIRLPAWLAAANWWLVQSSPVSVVFSIATGVRDWDQLVYEVGRMMGCQLVGTAIFTIAAIVRLRPAHRRIAGFDRQGSRRARRRLVWRLRPRPPVGDDPIVWKEKYTSREGGLIKALNVLILGGLTIGLVVGTFYFGRPAFQELWHHGYGATATSAAGHETNILIKVFLPGTGAGAAIDAARTDFNLFIRWATVAIVLITWFVVGAFAAEVVGVERAKHTWSSLLATPLTGREILRSAVLAALWRTRGGFGVVLILWGLGLAAGAIHPVGLLVSLPVAAASMWLTVAFCMLVSIRARSDESTTGEGPVLAILLTMTGALPISLPAGLNSVLWGAGCLPLMLWTSLVSYREVAAAVASPLDPQFQWLGPFGGQMPLLVVASWIIAIVGSFIGGLVAWRYAVAHFDRLVGRPHLPTEPAPTEATPGHHAAILSHRGSPLAEADGAV